MTGTSGTRKRRRAGRAAGAVIGSALVFGLTATAMANHTSTAPSTPVSDAGVTPVILSGDGLNPGGNRSCADLAHAGLISGDYTEAKRNYNSGAFESAFPANINVTVTDGKFVAWNSTHVVKAVIVKGSNAANIYAYNPTLPADSGLASPPNASEGPAGLSNLTFCYTPAPPKVTVAKIVEGVDKDPTQFSATLTGGGASMPFTGLVETAGPSAPQEIVAGTEYTLTEDQPLAPNYALKSISCSIGAASGTSWVFTPQAGDMVTCTITNTFTPPPPPPPDVPETPENPPGITTGTPTPPAVVTRTLSPRLAITKVAPSRARAGDTLVYTIRVRNTGRAIARNVVMSDPLPTGLTFVRASRPSSVTGRTVTTKLGNLRPGQARVVKITVRAAANVKGRKVNVATARATNVRPVRDAAPTVFRPLVRRVIPAVTG
jgi:uncharacterized repeat protein (TIGR01451 family)